jgi:hypothetical protein
VAEDDAAPLTPSLQRLLVRSLLLAVVVTCLLTAIAIAFDIANRHDSLDENPLFWGWQLYLIVALLAITTLVIASVGVVLRRRMPAAPGTTFKFLAAFLAVLLGGWGASSVALGSDHLMTWASKHTNNAHKVAAQDRAELRRVVGDANHRPVLRTFGRAASAKQSAGLLTPTDLGEVWSYGGTPSVTVRHPTDPAAASSVQTILTAEHWDGMVWRHDEDVIETATRFLTRDDAEQAIRDDLHASLACSLPSPCRPVTPYRRSHRGSVRIWQAPQTDPHTLDAIFSHDALVMRLHVLTVSGSAKPPLTGRAILRSAIRATS